MPRKPKKVKYQYSDFGEVIIPKEAAMLVGTSLSRMWEWLHARQTPMGPFVEGVHFYKAGYEYRIIKDRLCELFGILPKPLEQGDAQQRVP